jgi:guanosine-3',5'-bis(diphosphate) 3'-pyrophosphohydrolase
MDIVGILDALRFAAEKHRTRRRKDPGDTPFINHAIEVAHVLAGIGGITDAEVLQAALLHDVVEDTETTAEEVEQQFGLRVRRIVEEVTEDRTLRRAARKALLVQQSPHLSAEARQLRIVDMISNLRSCRLGSSPDWPLETRREYVDLAGKIHAGCRGISPKLDELFEQTLAAARGRGL